MPKLRGASVPAEVPEVHSGPKVNPYQWKPGQSGNPKGPPKGYRKTLSKAFVEDVHDSWMIYGKAALETTAMTEPSIYVRVVAGLVPKDIEVTVTNIRMERMTSRELEALVDRANSDPQDPIEAKEDPEGVFRVD